jgi:hypothetical protein
LYRSRQCPIMVTSHKEMAPQERQLPGTRPTEALGGTTVDERRISPAGDGFYAAAKYRPATDESPHGCHNGWVYYGLRG